MKYIILLVMLTVFCQCDMSADLQKVFTENEIIPDALNTAPKKILNVDIIKNLTKMKKKNQINLQCIFQGILWKWH